MTIALDKRATLSEQIRFLSRTEAHFSQEFFEKAVLTHLKKGQYVCHEGSRCGQLAILLQGSARVYKLGENGKEITLYRVGPGESCILTASCILSQLPFPAIAVCETDVEAVVIPAGDVQRWLSASSTWRDYIFGLVATRLTNIINVVEDVAFRRMDRRIADYLYNNTDRSSQLLLATHQEIAFELGTSREVVSRILKEFELDGVIRVTRGSIELRDPASLERRRHDV